MLFDVSSRMGHLTFHCILAFTFAFFRHVTSVLVSVLNFLIPMPRAVRLPMHVLLSDFMDRPTFADILRIWRLRPCRIVISINDSSWLRFNIFTDALAVLPSASQIPLFNFSAMCN